MLAVLLTWPSGYDVASHRRAAGLCISGKARTGTQRARRRNQMTLVHVAQQIFFSVFRSKRPDRQKQLRTLASCSPKLVLSFDPRLQRRLCLCWIGQRLLLMRDTFIAKIIDLLDQCEEMPIV